MEFEEMQAIWDSQNEEMLYAINEKALQAQIKRKGRSVEWKVEILEGVMMGVNLLVGVFLAVDAYVGSEPTRSYLLPAAYLFYAIVGLVLRLRRQREEVHFEPTMVGELDKAIWRIDYVIRQTRMMMVWYLPPLLLLAAIMLGLNGNAIWIVVLAAVVFPLAYFGGRWEVNKFYLPKKRSLESMREMLLKADAP